MCRRMNGWRIHCACMYVRKRIREHSAAWTRPFESVTSEMHSLAHHCIVILFGINVSEFPKRISLICIHYGERIQWPLWKCKHTCDAWCLMPDPSIWYLCRNRSWGQPPPPVWIFKRFHDDFDLHTQTRAPSPPTIENSESRLGVTSTP